LAAKKEARKKFYDIEKWSENNPQKQLDEAKQKYEKHKEQTEILHNQAMELKESHESGAIDSINKALKVSEDASFSITIAENKLNSQLKDLIGSLKNRLEAYKKNSDSSDANLATYYNSILQNMSTALNGVYDLGSTVNRKLVLKDSFTICLF
jgi:hypothetical protein